MTKNSWQRSDGARSPAVLGQPLHDPADWRPNDLKSNDEWFYTLSAAEVDEIQAAVAAVEKRGLDIKDVTKADFPLPRFGRILPEILDELMDGRGLALIRGLPADDMSRAEIAAAFWGIGSWLGTAISQNRNGHLLGHVKDLGADYTQKNVRGYYTNAHMGFHSDQCDILSLACLQNSKSGGTHMVCSSVALYNEMHRRRPDLAMELGWKFYRTLKGEVPIGHTEAWHRQGIFNFQDGYFSARGVSAAISKAQDLPGVPPLTEMQKEAMALYKTLAAELAAEIEFEHGDLFFLMNHVTLHSRTEYEDWPEPERKRHLLRIWLTTKGRRPLPPEIYERSQGITVPETVLVAPLDVE
jgi:hypothetical protein